MVKHCLKFLYLLAVIFVTSCASSFPIHLLCAERHVEIYVNDEYVGREQATYIVPKGVEYITVSCRIDDMEVYSRNLYVKGSKNELFELTIPKNYNYSGGNSVKLKTK